MVIYETERLAVRELQVGDEAGYFEVFGDPEISRFDDFEPISEEEAPENVRRIIEQYDAGSDEHEYAVVLKGSGSLIGILTIKDDGGKKYIGFHFGRSLHGKGYASESVRGLLGWLRQHFPGPICAQVFRGNDKSIKLLKSVGFVNRGQSPHNPDDDEYWFEG